MAICTGNVCITWNTNFVTDIVYAKVCNKHRKLSRIRTRNEWLYTIRSERNQLRR